MADNPPRPRETRLAGEAAGRSEEIEDSRPHTRERAKQKAANEDVRQKVASEDPRPRNATGQQAQAAGTTRITRSKSRTEGGTSNGQAVEGVVPEATQEQTVTKGKGKQRADREVEDEREPEAGEYHRPTKQTNVVDREVDQRPTRREERAVPSSSRKQLSPKPKSRWDDPSNSPDLIEMVNASLTYLNDSRRQIKKYKLQRVQEEERLDEMEEVANDMLSAMTHVVKRLNLPIADRENLLTPFEQVQGSSAVPNREGTRETTAGTGVVEEESQARHGKDRDTRLREAGLIGGRESGDASGSGRANREEDRSEERGRNPDRGQSGQIPQGGRVAAGAPEDGDGDGSSSDEDGGNPDRGRSPIPQVPRRVDRGSSRQPEKGRRESRVAYGRSTYYGANSISSAQPYSAALPTVQNAMRSIMKMLEAVLNADPDKLPPFTKHFKPQPPLVYNGEDNVNRFEGWVQGLARFYWIVRMVGPQQDEARVYAVGDALGGEALSWYTSEVMGPNRLRWDWTFLDVVLELHKRFVRQATVQLATVKFEQVVYKPMTGVSGLYTELMKYATQMVEHPGEYAIRRKFLKELPEEMSNTIMRSSKLTAEDNTMDELLDEALAIENAEKTARIFQKQKAGRGDARPTDGGSTTRAGNVFRPRTTGFRPMNRPEQRVSETSRPDAAGTSARPNRPSEAGTGGSISSAPKTSITKDVNASQKGSDVRRDLSNVQCYKCKQFGHLASAHDKPGFRAMTVDVDEGVMDDEVEEEESNLPEEHEGDSGPIEGEQYDSSPNDDPSAYEEYELEEDFYDAEDTGDLTFASMRVYEMHEESEESTEDIELNEADGPEAVHESDGGHPEVIALRIGIRNIQEPISQFIMNDHPEANPDRNPIDELIVGIDGMDIEWPNREDEERMERLQESMFRLLYEVQGLRTELMHVGWALEHGAPIRELAGIVLRARRREEVRVRGSQWSPHARLAHEAAMDMRATRLQHRDVIRHPTLTQLASRQIMAEIEALSRGVGHNDQASESEGEDDMPELEDIPPTGEGIVYPESREITVSSDEEEEDEVPPRVIIDRNIYDSAFADSDDERLDGMRTTPVTGSGEQFRSMEEDKGQRVAMRVTSQAKPRPALMSKCVTIRVTINGLQGIALVDTGSSINAVSPAFACVANLEAFPLERPVGLQLGCVGSRSKINYGINEVVEVGGQKLNTYLDVVNLDHYDVVLGIPFLRGNAVSIDFGTSSLRCKGITLQALRQEEKKIGNNAKERGKQTPQTTQE